MRGQETYPLYKNSKNNSASKTELERQHTKVPLAAETLVKAKPQRQTSECPLDL